ncbi:GspH/FimT family pseudopilin [Marinobacter sp. HL-58]|uniref:GspH/FimT family pseudopilin n=1 Tax=Marinobacter sp. HL-58 TaxID=1479237 RepID=UPI0006DA6569|nr:GspH/FimT family pseudopilin [Marinobacter sp. HL-58]KPQ01849.1 MAG: T4SS system assembly protein FimT [Marinobacter sp. HL-58]
MKYFNSGFTLIELMVTLVVLGILLGVGVPSFNSVIENNRVTTQANSLLGAINLARSEAVKRSAEVSIQSENGGFENGWCVIVGGLDNCEDAGNDGRLIRSFSGTRGVSMASGGTNGITFDSRGYRQVPAGDVAIDVESVECEADEQGLRRLTVSRAGRASLQQGVCE